MNQSINRIVTESGRVARQDRHKKRPLIVPKIEAPAEVEAREENKKKKRRGGEERREGGRDWRWMDGWMDGICHWKSSRRKDGQGTAARNPKKEGRVALAQLVQRG